MEKIHSIEQQHDGLFRLAGIEDGVQTEKVLNLDHAAIECAEACYLHHDETAEDICQNRKYGEDIWRRAGDFGSVHDIRRYQVSMAALPFPDVRNLDAEQEVAAHLELVAAFRDGMEKLIAWAAIEPGGEMHHKLAGRLQAYGEIFRCYTDKIYIEASRTLKEWEALKTRAS
jgi:hypothetical protein